MKNITYKPVVTRYFSEIKPRQVAMICPACSDEVTINEVIERRGSFGCINCLR